MSVDYTQLAVQGVRQLQPYIPGKPVDEVARELGLAPENIVKLASNENPLGPSSKVLEAITKAQSELTRYPDSNGYSLKNTLCAHLNVAFDQITLGNGSNDVLDLLARAFVAPGAEVIFSQYAFIVYPIVTQAVGGKAVVVPAVEWGHDLEAMAKAVTEKTVMVFLANPNNPTGTCFSRSELVKFLGQVPEHVIVVLDEAYFEYVDSEDYPNGLRLQQDLPNLVVCRTFSKAYGLAGLRVGYAVASPEITDMLNRVRQPFNVSSLALAAAEAALHDQPYLTKACQINHEGMEQITSALNAFEVSFIPSKGNFVTADFGENAAGINQQLLQQGVIVRPVANYGMARHLRISIGLPKENERLIKVLEQIL
ncbi:histidinol-phosphate transaminase [Zooshikella harenae]|uniref:Histidinol-phosphate aminotransferase n=1 Tax=Zooshikella harenae TaxID=2827238 RepID=A0ABS5ZAL1_9GAMM|nr:histidinol-phosphate transaminase [Zooshikella harenae]MBU2710356.1 histidinol-phosphate transaminase [Zooshikella harenae]